MRAIPGETIGCRAGGRAVHANEYFLQGGAQLLDFGSGLGELDLGLLERFGELVNLAGKLGA